MQHIKPGILDRELKKGSAELLILSLVEDQPRHGYDLSKLIEARSRRRPEVPRRVALPAALSPREARLDCRPLDREGRSAAPPLLPAHAGRRRRARLAAQHLARFRRGDQPDHGSRTCLNGRAGSAKRCASISTTNTSALRAQGLGHDDAMRRLARRRRRAGVDAVAAASTRCRATSVSPARAAQDPGLHRDRHADARARHRRQHGDLHRGRRRSCCGRCRTRTPTRLMVVRGNLHRPGVEEIPASAGEYVDFRDQVRSLEHIAAYDTLGFNLTGARRAGARRGRGGHREPVPAARRQRAARAHFRRRRGAAGARARRDPQPWAVDAPLPRGSRDRRSDGRDGWTSGGSRSA